MERNKYHVLLKPTDTTLRFSLTNMQIRKTSASQTVAFMYCCLTVRVASEITPSLCGLQGPLSSWCLKERERSGKVPFLKPPRIYTGFQSSKTENIDMVIQAYDVQAAWRHSLHRKHRNNEAHHTIALISFSQASIHRWLGFRKATRKTKAKYMPKGGRRDCRTLT